MTIYADLVMVLNGLVDFLLLMGTNRLSGFPAEGKRAAFAAVFGAAYSGVCLVPGFRFLGNTFWRLIALGGISGLAFGWNRSALKRSGMFLLLSMALGGMALGLGKSNIWTLALSAGMLWLVCAVSFDGRMGHEEYIPLEICYQGRRIRILALRDTGNALRDPITGEGVFILSQAAASRLTGLTAEQLANPLETITQRPISGLRLIPFHSVGCAGGMLLAMRMDQVKIGSRVQRAVVAFAPYGLGKGEVYQALIGGIV